MKKTQQQQNTTIVAITYCNKVQNYILETSQGLYSQITKMLEIQNGDILIGCNNNLCRQNENIAMLRSRLKIKECQLQIYSVEEVFKGYVNKSNSFKEQQYDNLQVVYKELQKIHTNETESLKNQITILQSLINQLKSSVQTSLTIDTNDHEQMEQANKTKSQEEQLQQYKNTLITKHEQEISRLRGRSNFQSLMQSVSQTQFSICYFCNQDIGEDEIRLNCDHSYHENCVKDLVNAQLVEKKELLQCICQVKIQKKTLTLLDHSFSQTSLFQLHMYELKKIKQDSKYIFKTCKNKNCYFFYIQQGNSSSSYCPVCLQ